MHITPAVPRSNFGAFSCHCRQPSTAASTLAAAAGNLIVPSSVKHMCSPCNHDTASWISELIGTGSHIRTPGQLQHSYAFSNVLSVGVHQLNSYDSRGCPAHVSLPATNRRQPSTPSSPSHGCLCSKHDTRCCIWACRSLQATHDPVTPNTWLHAAPWMSCRLQLTRSPPPYSGRCVNDAVAAFAPDSARAPSSAQRLPASTPRQARSRLLLPRRPRTAYC